MSFLNGGRSGKISKQFFLKEIKRALKVLETKQGKRVMAK